jgi:steroid 5-alpha reductase family enzyme
MIRLNNYGFLDAAWSLSIAVLAPLYALLGDGNPTRKLAFCAVGAAWSLNESIHSVVQNLASRSGRCVADSQCLRQVHEIAGPSGRCTDSYRM